MDSEDVLNILLVGSDTRSLDERGRTDSIILLSIDKKNKKTIIGNNVILYPNAIILNNSSIGDNSKVGAGAVVTHDVPANVIVAGNPARVIKELS